MKYFACHEHVEEALDHIIDEKETAPNIVQVEEKNVPCSFCRNKAVYKISG